MLCSSYIFPLTALINIATCREVLCCFGRAERLLNSLGKEYELGDSRAMETGREICSMYLTCLLQSGVWVQKTARSAITVIGSAVCMCLLLSRLCLSSMLYSDGVLQTSVLASV